jgi:hypothetical protein
MQLEKELIVNLKFKLTLLLNELPDDTYYCYSKELLQENINTIVNSILVQKYSIPTQSIPTQSIPTQSIPTHSIPFHKMVYKFDDVYECDNCYGEDCRDYCVNESWDY